MYYAQHCADIKTGIVTPHMRGQVCHFILKENDIPY